MSALLRSPSPVARRQSSVAGTLALLAAVLAWAPITTSSATAGAIQRSDTVIRIVAAPQHPGVAELQQEVSIGQVSGPPHYEFAEVAEVAVGPDGSIYVFDRGVPALREYDSRGGYVRTISRQGQGPGEYTTGGGLAVTRTGRVLLWDTGNWRINVYSQDGANLAEWRTPSGSSGSMTLITSRSLVLDTTGHAYISRRLFQRGGGGSTVWIRIDSTGAAVDTIPEPGFNVQQRSVTATTPDGAGSSSMGLPFAPNPEYTLSPFGYFVTGVPSRMAVELRIPRGGPGTGPGAWKPGDPVVSIRREVAPTPVSARERDSARADVEERLRRVDSRFSFNAAEIPRNKPFYSGIHVGMDGSIWVAIVRETARRVGNVSGSGGNVVRGGTPRMSIPRPARETPPQPALYDVYMPDGSYVGQVRIPPRVATVQRTRDRVWAVAYDEDEVASVRRYRIAWK